MGDTGRWAHDLPMTTLHIDINVNDLNTFRAGFADHAEIRHQAGVRAEHVRQAIDDPNHLLVQLDFDSVDRAEAFVGFLREKIWKDSPVLVGTPQATILEPLDLATAAAS